MFQLHGRVSIFNSATQGRDESCESLERGPFIWQVLPRDAYSRMDAAIRMSANVYGFSSSALINKAGYTADNESGTKLRSSSMSSLDSHG